MQQQSESGRNWSRLSLRGRAVAANRSASQQSLPIQRTATAPKQLKSMFESDTYYHPRLDL